MPLRTAIRPRKPLDADYPAACRNRRHAKGKLETYCCRVGQGYRLDVRSAFLFYCRKLPAHGRCRRRWPACACSRRIAAGYLVALATGDGCDRDHCCAGPQACRSGAKLVTASPRHHVDQVCSQNCQQCTPPADTSRKPFREYSPIRHQLSFQVRICREGKWLPILCH